MKLGYGLLNLLLCIVTAIIGCKAYIDIQYLTCALALSLSILNYFTFVSNTAFHPHTITMVIGDTQFLSIGDILSCYELGEYNGYYEITKILDKTNLELKRITWLKAWKVKIFGSNEKR